MISQQYLNEHWDDLKEALQQRWGHLTDEELQQTRGDKQLLMGALERRTGLSQQQVNDFLDETIGGESPVGYAVSSARRYAQRASGAAHEQLDHAAERLHAGYENAEGLIRRRPGQSLTAAFGAGLIAGVVAGLVLCRNRR